jgi:hypothetical protein
LLCKLTDFLFQRLQNQATDPPEKALRLLRNLPAFLFFRLQKQASDASEKKTRHYVQGFFCIAVSQKESPTLGRQAFLMSG